VGGLKRVKTFQTVRGIDIWMTALGWALGCRCSGREKIIKKGYVRSRGVKIKCHFLTAVSENGGAGEVWHGIVGWQGKRGELSTLPPSQHTQQSVMEGLGGERIHHIVTCSKRDEKSLSCTLAISYSLYVSLTVCVRTDNVSLQDKQNQTKNIFYNVYM